MVRKSRSQTCQLEFVNWSADEHKVPLIGKCVACNVTFDVMDSVDADENVRIIENKFRKHVDATRKKARLPPMDL